MSRKTLSLDFDYDFELISIISSWRDYRLCWQLNRTLGFDFKKLEDIEINLKRKKVVAWFSNFYFSDEINFLSYFFFSNKSTGAFLVPELKKVDYFLMIQGSNASIEKMEIIKKIKNLPGIEALFETHPDKLASRQNLIFQ